MSGIEVTQAQLEAEIKAETENPSFFRPKGEKSHPTRRQERLEAELKRLRKLYESGEE